MNTLQQKTEWQVLINEGEDVWIYNSKKVAENQFWCTPSATELRKTIWKQTEPGDWEQECIRTDITVLEKEAE